MHINTIIQSLTDLLAIHKELIELSEQKTEIVKDGSAEKLQKIVIAEHKVVQKLELSEINRQQVVEQWFLEKNKNQENMTNSKIMNLLTDETEKVKLGEITLQLTEAITHLKQQEQLNQELLRQSLQFVQVSLNTMNPTMENINYGNANKQTETRHSVFDSKA